MPISHCLYEVMQLHLSTFISKAARKELRHFIRANQNYQFVVKTSFGSSGMSNEPDRTEKSGGGEKVEDDDDDEEDDENMGGGLFNYILRSLLGTRVRPAASSASSTKDLSTKVRALT